MLAESHILYFHVCVCSFQYLGLVWMTGQPSRCTGRTRLIRTSGRASVHHGLCSVFSSGAIGGTPREGRLHVPGRCSGCVYLGQGYLIYANCPRTEEHLQHLTSERAKRYMGCRPLCAQGDDIFGEGVGRLV